MPDSSVHSSHSPRHSAPSSTSSPDASIVPFAWRFSWSEVFSQHLERLEKKLMCQKLSPTLDWKSRTRMHGSQNTGKRTQPYWPQSLCLEFVQGTLCSPQLNRLGMTIDCFMYCSFGKMHTPSSVSSAETRRSTKIKDMKHVMCIRVDWCNWLI